MALALSGESHRLVRAYTIPLIDPGEPTLDAQVPLPPIVARALNEPLPPPMPWYRGIAPAYLTLFFWPPFFDQLWAGDVQRAGPWWLVGTAIVGALVCFGLYFLAASWGSGARRGLVVVASSTFGAAGSEWLCGLAIAFAAIVWYALAINFAVESTLLGLRACGMLAPERVAHLAVGPLEIKSPVFLGTALFWIYITRQAIRMKLPGVVVGLMKVYSPIAVILLTAAAAWRLPYLWAGPGTAALLESARAEPPSQAGALSMMIGFFATSALLSVDWGAAVRERRDILRAGLPGVLVAAASSSILALLIVLETMAKLPSGGDGFSASPLDPMPFSFRWAIFEGRDTFPPGAAAGILILFGLAALANAVSTLNKFSEGVSTHWPAFTPRWATIPAGLVALCLMATGQVDRLEPTFIAMGSLFMPALGAIAGDLTGRIKEGLTVRNGFNPAGILAWAAGCAVAVAMNTLASRQGDQVFWLEQGSICGFVISACVYRLLAAFSFPRSRVGTIA
jgi:cytosine permease